MQDMSPSWLYYKILASVGVAEGIIRFCLFLLTSIISHNVFCHCLAALEYCRYMCDGSDLCMLTLVSIYTGLCYLKLFVPVSTAYPTGYSLLFLLILRTSFVAEFTNLEQKSVSGY